MRMRGTIALKTPSMTMPIRAPMMIVLVISRLLVEERRIDGQTLRGRDPLATTDDSSGTLADPGESCSLGSHPRSWFEGGAAAERWPTDCYYRV
jgi:hypothetical protein